MTLTEPEIEHVLSPAASGTRGTLENKGYFKTLAVISEGGVPHHSNALPYTPGTSKSRVLLQGAPSPTLTWVAKVKLVVHVTVVVPVPQDSVGFVVVADKDRKEEGGGPLEEQAQQRQDQAPVAGSAGHGCGCAVPGPSRAVQTKLTFAAA